MSPDNARIFFVEDDVPYRETYTMVLKTKGHSVVAFAGSQEEALKIVPQLKEKGVQVAIVDGNLTKDDFSGLDGEDIANAIRKHDPKIKIIGNAGSEFIGPCDVDFQKGKGPNELDRIIKGF